ncbi:N-acetyltransferase [Paenibacillus albiflavus]|uniref:N-acetyltransferase n=1 Tax=Paenibacillus albiflavus TaxID=2545760 RepID=A0A4R4EGT0_9BACL|nr:GNAT family N-acetyltransferase [Paenibacillus albiflavus]TCZ79296.1 N-acetyltransferase [Paenibacillus albiflavus]
MIKSMKIETNRLIIRPYVENDFEASFALMQNKDLFQYMHMDVMSMDEYRHLFNWLIRSYDKGLDENFKYSFGLFLKDSNTFIGWIGIGGLDFKPEDKEIYYLIGKEYWGNGYASEAASHLIQYGFETMKLQRIVAKVDPRNVASKRIIEKSGLKFECIVDHLPEEYSECNGELLYSISVDEWWSKG